MVDIFTLIKKFNCQTNLRLWLLGQNFFGNTYVSFIVIFRMSNCNFETLHIDHCYVFCFTTQEIPMVCEDAVLPDPLLRTNSVYCLTFGHNSQKSYNVNLCLFRTPKMHSNRIQKSTKKTSKLVIFLNVRAVDLILRTYQVFCMKDRAEGKDTVGADCSSRRWPCTSQACPENKRESLFWCMPFTL